MMMTMTVMVTMKVKMLLQLLLDFHGAGEEILMVKVLSTGGQDLSRGPLRTLGSLGRDLDTWEG